MGDAILDMVKEDGMDLKYISAREQDEEICMAAVQQNPEAIKFIKNPALRAKIKEALNK